MAMAPTRVPARPSRRGARAAMAIELAGESDAAAIVEVRSAAAAELTRRHGPGHWSSCPTERSVLAGMRRAKVLVARTDDSGAEIVGTLRLQTKKPWAIDKSFFTPVARPLFLVDMAVTPVLQRTGVGRALLARADEVARAWPANALWLDAYDAPAGAGEFYARCGYALVGRAVYRGVPLVYYERKL